MILVLPTDWSPKNTNLYLARAETGAIFFGSTTKINSFGAITRDLGRVYSTQRWRWRTRSRGPRIFGICLWCLPACLPACPLYLFMHRMEVILCRCVYVRVFCTCARALALALDQWLWLSSFELRKSQPLTMYTVFSTFSVFLYITPQAFIFSFTRVNSAA